MLSIYICPETEINQAEMLYLFILCVRCYVSFYWRPCSYANNSLPELQALPSAKNFAEFFLSRALGKGCLYRVPELEHSIKTRPSAKLVFAECSGSALTLGKDFLCRVSTSDTRQILAHR